MAGEFACVVGPVMEIQEKQVWGNFDEFIFGYIEFECLWEVQEGKLRRKRSAGSWKHRQRFWEAGNTGRGSGKLRLEIRICDS